MRRLLTTILPLTLCPAPLLRGQELTWSASSTYVKNDVHFTLSYELTNDCRDRRTWSGTQLFEVVAPQVALTDRRSHVVHFVLPPDADRFQWYDDAAHIRWFAALVADSLILSNAPGGEVSWRLAAPIQGLPVSTLQPLDLTLHPEWPTFNQHVQDILTRRIPEAQRNCPTLNAMIREHVGEIIDEMGIRPDIRDAIRGFLQDLAEGGPDKALDVYCDAVHLEGAERDALENFVRAFRAVPWGCAFGAP